MDEREQLERALAVLKDFVGTLAVGGNPAVRRTASGTGILSRQRAVSVQIRGSRVYAGRHPCMAGGSFQAVYGQAGRDEPVQTGQALAGLF